MILLWVNFMGNMLLAQTVSPISSASTMEIVDHSDVMELMTKHKMIIKEKPITQGYRIQIFNTTDKNEALTAKSNFYNKFPHIRCYTSYVQPYYKVKVGDYQDEQEARADLKSISRAYPSSFLVFDIIKRKKGEEDSETKSE